MSAPWNPGRVGSRAVLAFLGVILVLGVVVGRAAQIAFCLPGTQPRQTFSQNGPPADFDIVDAKGLPLAVRVERVDLVLSPQAMWRAHTPGYMAGVIASELGGLRTAGELLERFLPGTERGWMRAANLELSRAQAERLDRLFRRDPELHEAWMGFELAAGDGRSGAPEIELWWAPEEVLSRRVREACGSTRPLSFTNRLLDALLETLDGEAMPPIAGGDEAHAQRKLVKSSKEHAARREALWTQLMPCRFRIAVAGLSTAVASDLADLLRREAVHDIQMKLETRLERCYPMRDEAAGRVDALRVVGRRSIVGEGTQAVAIDGLERMAERLLGSEAFDFLDRRPRHYTYRVGRIERRRERLLDGWDEACESPRVWTTLDSRVQMAVHDTLVELRESHDAALTQAIVIDVGRSEVIAVDAVDPYGMSAFAPVWHTFTPGSTLKAVVMATALDAGVVEPDDVFDTFDGAYRVPNSRRTIHEARGAPTGEITAAEAVALSCNAVMVQIGARLTDRRLHDTLQELGYGVRVDSGFPDERPGILPGLPWSMPYTQASICFGHNLTVNLWQHAAALASVVRGGEWRPLSMLACVEQEDRYHTIPRTEARRVLSSAACHEVREMMRLGAREGTGRPVAPEDLDVGTKTGTAEKTPTEFCLHVELAHRHAHEVERTRCSRACLARERGVKDHKRSCYTSSMCIFGRVPGSEREILVLVVVEEPRTGKKYGAEVAGVAAVEILREALDLTRNGEEPLELAPSGFGLAADTGRSGNEGEQDGDLHGDHHGDQRGDHSGHRAAAGSEEYGYEEPWREFTEERVR